ncbi:MAG: hypothetical protein R2827_04630 [Bdellovibrionales bacterium]
MRNDVHFIEFAGQLFFAGRDTGSNFELWATDGTTGGTVEVKEIYPGTQGSDIGHFAVFAGYLYFSANDSVNGIELWRSDGTTGGTALFKNIVTGGAGSHSLPKSLTAVGSQLFFTATDGTNGEELWVSDGTSIGTQMVKDIRPGSSSSAVSFPRFKAFNSLLLFLANDGVNGDEPWVSDGTAGGTMLLKDINPGSNFSNAQLDTAVELNGYLYFFATSSGQLELWRTDATPGGTEKVFEMNTAYLSELIVINNEIYFSAATETTGRELYKSDGTTEGTILIRDFNFGANEGAPANFWYSNTLNKFFFFVDDGQHQREPWSIKF